MQYICSRTYFFIKSGVFTPDMERKIEKKDSGFFSIQLAESEQVNLKVGEKDEIVFIVPYDCVLNCYIKKETIPIQFK